MNCLEITINEKVVRTIKAADTRGQITGGQEQLRREIDDQILPSKEISNCSDQNANLTLKHQPKS